jgi:hypothetical protein
VSAAFFGIVLGCSLTNTAGVEDLTGADTRLTRAAPGASEGLVLVVGIVEGDIEVKKEDDKAGVRDVDRLEQEATRPCDETRSPVDRVCTATGGIYSRHHLFIPRPFWFLTHYNKFWIDKDICYCREKHKHVLQNMCYQVAFGLLPPHVYRTPGFSVTSPPPPPPAKVDSPPSRSYIAFCGDTPSPCVISTGRLDALRKLYSLEHGIHDVLRARLAPQIGCQRRGLAQNRVHRVVDATRTRLVPVWAYELRESEQSRGWLKKVARNENRKVRAGEVSMYWADAR